ncbi:hypothetical protein ACHAQJ_006829 [Trichoderma viride]
MTIVNQHPVFMELAVIQQGIDKFPSPADSHFRTCRALNKNGIDRCKTSSCGKEIDILLSEFQNMTECPDTDDFYTKLETFITLTHCGRRHRDKPLEAFNDWKRQRKTAGINLPPVASMTSLNVSGSSSLESLSGISITTPPSSAPDSPKHDGLDLEGRVVKDMESLTLNSASKNSATNINGDKKEELEYMRGILGTIDLPDEGAKTNYAAIYEAMRIPSKDMDEGIVYIYEHKEIPGLFKIGKTKTSGEKRRRRAQNCNGIDARLIYQSEDGPFVGAFQAEKIAHASLEHKNLMIHKCIRCKGRHTEWYLTTQDEVFIAVEGAEAFVRRPTYARQQEKWELTKLGHAISNKIRNYTDVAALTLKQAVEDQRNLNSALDKISGTTPAPTAQDTENEHQGESRSPRHGLQKGVPAAAEGIEWAADPAEGRRLAERRCVTWPRKPIDALGDNRGTGDTNMAPKQKFGAGREIETILSNFLQLSFPAELRGKVSELKAIVRREAEEIEINVKL